MNKFIYEARPYFYGLIAFYALIISKNSLVMVVSGLLMALCCMFVTVLRYDHRKHLVVSNKKVSSSNQFPKTKSYHGQNKYFVE